MSIFHYFPFSLFISSSFYSFLPSLSLIFRSLPVFKVSVSYFHHFPYFSISFLSLFAYFLYSWSARAQHSGVGEIRSSQVTGALSTVFTASRVPLGGSPSGGVTTYTWRSFGGHTIHLDNNEVTW